MTSLPHTAMPTAAEQVDGAHKPKTYQLTDTEPNKLLALAEAGVLPDALIRFGIRRLLKDRLKQCAEGGIEAQARRYEALLEADTQAPIATDTQAANDQHYQVPPAFFEHMLGPHLKYSCCQWEHDTRSLGEAEANALNQIAQRADLQDGQHLLDLGCGWGSVSLTMAKRFPNMQITAVSNSSDQREHIESQAQKHGLANLTVLTCDANQLQLPEQQFDRIVSVEMMEHVSNHTQLFQRLAGWLKPQGKLFVHVFSHKQFAYKFETEGDDNWMGRHFFTGGIMPSHHHLPRCAESVPELALQHHWAVDGKHYQQTAEAWLTNLDNRRADILSLLKQDLAEPDAKRWLQRWRMFVMACAELWGYESGQQWHVSHHLWQKH